ncbi:hypothetical protein SOVF_207660 [Spinacia oleracea]|nr:hypothetical protein SOVF_207660 [Spinacia oleracea]
MSSSSSSSGKFKGQGRVLGSSSSSSGPTNPNPIRPSSAAQTVHPKPLITPPRFDQRPTSFEGQKGSIPNPKSNPDSNPNHPSSIDGFDPFDSLITTGKRNKNGYSLNNVFECPVCGSGFTSEEEVSSHIESCITAKTSNGSIDDAADLDSASNPSMVMNSNENKVESTNKLEGCIGVYLSGNPSDSSVDIVMRLFRNTVKEPENPKFRRIRMSNPKIREAIGEVTGGIELLEEVGFELKEEGGEMWAVMDTPSEEQLLMLKNSVNLIEQAKSSSLSSSLKVASDKVEVEKKVKENEPLIIDRQIKVFFSVSESVAARITLPDSFYKLSSEEVRREAELRKKKMAESQLLIPKSFKEKQAQAARKRYTRTIIRVQFPDGVVLQGVFSPKESTSALYEFVSVALKQEGLEFELIHPVPLKRRLIPCFPAPGERASTLEQEDLVPSALVKFKPIETDSMMFTGLRNELLEISEPL